MQSFASHHVTVIHAGLLEAYAEAPTQAPYQRKWNIIRQLHRCRAVPSQNQAGAGLMLSAASPKEACSLWFHEERVVKTTRSF